MLVLAVAYAFTKDAVLRSERLSTILFTRVQISVRVECLLVPTFKDADPLCDAK
jgi:hypothetical protein